MVKDNKLPKFKPADDDALCNLFQDRRAGKAPADANHGSTKEELSKQQMEMTEAGESNQHESGLHVNEAR